MALFSYLYTMEIKDMQALIEENKRLQAQIEKLSAEKAELENTVSSLKSMMDWFRKKLFGKMSEKNLPLDPSALEPTLFDEQLSEDEQAALDAEVKAMEEQNAKTIEVKAHKREVRKPVYSNLPVIVTDIYPEGMKDNPDYVEIGVENTDRLAIRPAQMYIDRIARHKFVLKSSLQMEDPDRPAFEISSSAGNDNPEGDGLRKPSGGHPHKQVLLSPAFLPSDTEIQGTGRRAERCDDR